MKEWFFYGLLTTLMIAVGVWYFVFYKPVYNRTTVNDLQQIEVPIATLISEFVSNDTAAHNKYSKKVIATSGNIEEVITDTAGVKVFISTGVAATSLSVRLKEAKAIQYPGTISVRGIYLGYIDGELQLNEAVIVKNEPITVVADTNKKIVSTTVDDTQDSVVAVIKSKSGKIKFYSHTVAEDIEATNTQVISNINVQTGEVSFGALIKGFRFENELMQKHFNEKDYMHSDVYPRAGFKGKITNIAAINFKQNGSYMVMADGSLTIRGVTKPLKVKGTIVVKEGKFNLNAVFGIQVKAFNVPGDDVAETIEITVQTNY
jgi:polyisoprenoid-binding protein YceI